MDIQELKLSKKLISSYKKRLEKEILERSIKLKMPQKKFEEIINNNNELINLKKALKELETTPQASNWSKAKIMIIQSRKSASN